MKSFQKPSKMRAMIFLMFFLKRARREGSIRLIEIENGHENVSFIKKQNFPRILILFIIFWVKNLVFM